MQLLPETKSDSSVQAGYVCTCGCKPQVMYEKGLEKAEDVCCCSTQFVVGPDAESRLTPQDGFRVEVQEFEAPWGESLEAAWAVGSGTHPH